MKAQLNWAVSGLLAQTVFTQGVPERKENREECEKELRSAAGTRFNENSKMSFIRGSPEEASMFTSTGMLTIAEQCDKS